MVLGYASLLPVPYQSILRRQKKVCKVSVIFRLSYKNTPFHRNVKRKFRQNEFSKGFSRQMSRNHKYCIVFSCFFRSVFRLFQNASTFRRKLFDILLKMHLRLEQNSLVFWIKRKYVFRCLLSCWKSVLNYSMVCDNSQPSYTFLWHKCEKHRILCKFAR